VRQGNLMAATFHPELSDDRRVHRLFVDLVREQMNPIRVSAEESQSNTETSLS